VCFQLPNLKTIQKTMDKESFLQEFMAENWNKQSFKKVEQYVHKEYKIHLYTTDPWKGKTLTHSEYKEGLKFSFKSFPDLNFEITSTIQEENHIAITWILTGTNPGMIGEYTPTKKDINTKGMTIYHFKTI
jgi:predicted ester cyclase